MSEVKYWIDVFTPQTWAEFKAAGGDVSGFPERMRNTVEQIKPGDILVCYVAQISRWIGTLEVVEGHFVDDSPVWSGDRKYSERLRVSPIIELELETAVPAVALKDNMPMFESLANPNKWSIFFRRSPSKMAEVDAEIVIEALKQAAKDPVHKPIPVSKQPKLVKSGDGPEVRGQEENTNEDDVNKSTAPTGSDHTEIQWRLLRLGAEMGLNVWAPKSDRNRRWGAHTPGEVTNLLDELPQQFAADAMRTIGNIDVLWLQGDTFMAAFEIENSTSIYSGLLRMSDLLALVPNLSIPLYVVAPDERRQKVFREVNRPTFSKREQPLQDICQYISYSALRDGYEAVKSYAQSMKPSVVQQWAEVCETEDD